MTVGDLIVELQKFDPELEVGGSDDMGHIEEIDYISVAMNGHLCIKMIEGWRE